MIDYIEQLSDEEKEQITEVIRLLYRQTFILERKYDRRAEKWQYSREYKICAMHMEFLKEYFQVAGIELVENIYLGVIYIRDGMLMGEKIPRLATIYILVLKILYDEQMAQRIINMESQRLMDGFYGDDQNWTNFESLYTGEQSKWARADLYWQKVNPNTLMHIYVFGVSTRGERTTAVARLDQRTAEADKSDMTFDVSVVEENWQGGTYKVVPSNDEDFWVPFMVQSSDLDLFRKGDGTLNGKTERRGRLLFDHSDVLPAERSSCRDRNRDGPHGNCLCRTGCGRTGRASDGEGRSHGEQKPVPDLV